MSALPRLRAEGITVRRGRRVIVEGFDLDHGPGSVAWLVGENGGGKTTLLRVLAGLEPPGAGTVRHGAESGPPPQRSYYHPDMRLPPGTQVSEWQAMVARLGLPEREIPGLTPPFAKPAVTAEQLSTGEEKRLILDAVLSNGRDHVFLDEPFEHLSPEGKELLADRLGRLARTRVVVVATNQAVPDALMGGPVVRLVPGDG
jgi:ABC-type multidrug transport system ATPase subunit